MPRRPRWPRLLENTFRHVNIALVNEMLRFSQEPRHRPVGRHRLRRDQALRLHGLPPRPRRRRALHPRRPVVPLAPRQGQGSATPSGWSRLAEEINHAAPDYVASRVWSLLNDQGKAVNGSNVLLLGVTYKPNIADCRESPADPLAARLASWGAKVSYHDPFVPQWSPRGSAAVLTCAPDLDAALAAADVVVLLQPHAQYDLDAIGASGAKILDTRGATMTAPTVTRL